MELDSSPRRPLIVQTDKTLLLHLDHPRAEAARRAITAFAELDKAPGPIHIYRLSPLSLWNAAASGLTADDVLATLTEFSVPPLPDNVRADVHNYMARYGRVQLRSDDGGLVLCCDDAALLDRVENEPALREHWRGRVDAHTLRLDPSARGAVKQALIQIGYPTQDLAGYTPGTPLAIHLRAVTARGQPFMLRDYQRHAVAACQRAGSGVVVLPCGAGKTVVGLGLMAAQQTQTLILTSSVIAARQWISEILDKTDLAPDQVGEYSGEHKAVRPVTVATYQVLINAAPFVDTATGEIGQRPHLSLFGQADWGLIIYDEVHLLPAPVFRLTAEIQARRRLGLTATLVREDGREGDVFALIGPVRERVPWRELERAGWIAPARCCEIRLPMELDDRLTYVLAAPQHQYRLAAENPAKLRAARTLAEKHAGDQVLIIGQYLSQLRQLAAALGAPLITGATPNARREQLYAEFRRGALKRLVVSKVVNYAVDLPDANVAIQVSGTFGSRQEEAQRLGRLLRPKANGGQAHFYSLVTRDSRDQFYAAKRQRFLVEQGYEYSIVDGIDGGI